VIDCENEVYSTVVAALRAKYPSMNPSSGEKQPTPADMPAAVGREMDNSTYLRSLDSSGQENHATVMWQWEAYSNKSSGKKSECKSIMAIIDDEMQDMGFVRIGSSPAEVPNADKTIYRMVARYRATVSKDKTIHRR
jgi:hypothetical protein